MIPCYILPSLWGFVNRPFPHGAHNFEEAKALYLDCIGEAIAWLADRIRSIGIAPARGLFLYTSELDFGSDIMHFDPRVDPLFRMRLFRKVGGSKDASVPIGVLVDADSNIPFAMWTDKKEVMTSLEALFGRDLPPICFSMTSQSSPFKDFMIGINSRDLEERRWFEGLFKELEAFRERLRGDS